jgi:protein-tyrosine phosphatase
MTDRWTTFAGPVFNFRDVGGLTTADGRRVRSGRLFRSDSLGGLREADREVVARLGVHTVIDLRQPVEIDSYRRAPEWSCRSWRHIPLNNPVWRHEDYSAEAGVTAFLVARYLEMLEHTGPELVEAIRIIADPGSGPTVVHCLGGRDRTGVIVALVLELLGVPEDQIAADYTLTELGMQRFTDWAAAHRPDLAPLEPYIALTPAIAMSTFLAELRARYGSAREYLLGQGLTTTEIDELRACLLEGAEPAQAG